MKSRSRSMIVAALAAMISASPAQAGGLKQVAEISIPGDPITDIGIMAIDQTTGLGYLADKTNKSVVVFDTKTDKFVARIPGFVGLLKDGNASGPNGVVVVGAEVWVSDGDSKIKMIHTKTGQITGTVATGGTKRANGMALGEDIGVVIVANSNDDPPVLELHLDCVRSQNPGEDPYSGIRRELGAFRISRAKPHVLHSHPGITRGHHQGIVGADRSQKRQAREAARTWVSSA